MGQKANTFNGNVVVGTENSVGFGISSDPQVLEATGPQLLTVLGDPNGSVIAPRGSVALQRDTAALWQNTDGLSTWASVGSGGGGGGTAVQRRVTLADMPASTSTPIITFGTVPKNQVISGILLYFNAIPTPPASMTRLQFSAGAFSVVPDVYQPIADAPLIGTYGTGSISVNSAPLTLPASWSLSGGLPDLVANNGPRVPGANNFDGTLGTTAAILADIQAAINDPANAYATTISAAAPDPGGFLPLTSLVRGTAGNITFTANVTIPGELDDGGLTSGVNAPVTNVGYLSAQPNPIILDEIIAGPGALVDDGTGFVALSSDGANLDEIITLDFTVILLLDGLTLTVP
jgi:hypothetical protein